LSELVPIIGEGVGEAVGVGLGDGVGVGALVRLAVIVPGPFIVVVVESCVVDPNVMFPVLLDHEENV
jgi:hypothetical protein